MRSELAPVQVCIIPCAVVFAMTVTTGAPVLVAQPAGCYTIQPGDTAAYIALRLTGRVVHRDEPWFQIIDTARSRVIPKAEYGRILPGWLTCIPEARLSTAWSRQEHPGPADRVPQRAAGFAWTFGTVDALSVWCGVAVLLATMFASSAARTYFSRRRAIAKIMHGFGERFICEFERPLIQPGCVERPLESRLRVIPHRKQLEILLAPAGGRRYPNLSDHRGNLKYDVERVLRLLRDERFAGSRLCAQGRWVVVACRFRVGSERGGGS